MGEVCYDYRLINVPGAMAGPMVALAAMARAAYVEEVVAGMRRRGLAATSVCPSPVALFHAYRTSPQYDENKSVCVLDIGQSKIDKVLASGPNLLFARTVTGGADRFTEAIAKATGAKPDRAEAFKLERAALDSGPPPEGDDPVSVIKRALGQAGDAIVGHVVAAIRYFRAQTKQVKADVDRVLLCGGGARMKGLKEYLAFKMEVPVEFLAADERFEQGGGPTLLAIAKGLAVAAADPTAFRLEMTPASVLRRRRFLSKTVFAFAAVPVYVAALGWMAMSSSKAKREAVDYETLQQTRRQAMEERKARLDASAEKLRQDRAVCDVYAREGRLGLVMSEFLARLRNNVPPGMVVTQVTVSAGFAGAEPPKAAEPGAAKSFDLHMEGEIDIKVIPADKISEALQTLNAAMEREETAGEKSAVRSFKSSLSTDLAPSGQRQVTAEVKLDPGL
jgi:cell division ATPase FtsA